MQFDGRALFGPGLAAATMLTAAAIDRYLIGLPNPAPLLVLITAFAGSVSGFRSGLVSAAIAIVGSALFFLDHPASPGYQTSDLIQLAMLAVTAGATAAITGLLRQRLRMSAPNMPPRSGWRRRSTKSTSALCCSMRTHAPSSSIAPSAPILACPMRRRTASPPSSR
jgi:hypothetical protein